MGNTLASDTIPVLITMVDVHNPKSQDMFYFCNISSGGASTKVIGRSQTLSVEVGITSVISFTVYECPEPVFTPETARALGILRVPIERLAERYSSGIFQQWFNLDTKTDPRMPGGDPQLLVSRFEQAYTDAVVDVYQPKICVSVIGSAFEVQRGARQAFSIFVGEDVKTQAGPDLKALIASHKQQAAYIDALHEEVRRLNVPSYRPVSNAPQGAQMPADKLDPVQPAPMYPGGMPNPMMQQQRQDMQRQQGMPPMQPPMMQQQGMSPMGSQMMQQQNMPSMQSQMMQQQSMPPMQTQFQGTPGPCPTGGSCSFQPQQYPPGGAVPSNLMSLQ